MSSSVDVIAILKKAKQKRKGFVNGAKTSVQQQKLLHEVRQLSPDAVQNYAIKIPGKSYLRHADVAIPYLRLDFEYDGKYYHAGKDKKQDDNYRDFELKALGWNDEDIRQAKAVAGKLHQSGAPAPEQMQQIQQGVQKAAELNSQPTEQTVQTEPYVQVETIPNPTVQQKSEQPNVQVDTGANSSQQNNASWNMVTIGASIGAAAAIGGGIFAVKTRKVRN